MKNLIRPAALALYLLSILVFFLLGVYLAKWSGAGENQGLAAAAIVLGYGVMAAAGALLTALLLAYKLSTPIIIRINWIGLSLLLVLIALTAFNVNQRAKKNQEKLDQEMPAKPRKTSPPADQQLLLSSMSIAKPVETPGYLGMFALELMDNNVIHLYSNPLATGAEAPVDSLITGKDKYGSPAISYAPPQFYPEHFKPDYNICLLKLVSLSRDWVELEINKSNQSRLWVPRAQGKVLLWPDFLMTVHSIEALPDSELVVRIKALSHASIVSTDYDFLRVIAVRDQWAKVELLTDDMKAHGTGWVQWHDNGRLNFRYNLLS